MVRQSNQWNQTREVPDSASVDPEGLLYMVYKSGKNGWMDQWRSDCLLGDGTADWGLSLCLNEEGESA